MPKAGLKSSFNSSQLLKLTIPSLPRPWAATTSGTLTTSSWGFQSRARGVTGWWLTAARTQSRATRWSSHILRSCRLRTFTRPTSGCLTKTELRTNRESRRWASRPNRSKHHLSWPRSRPNELSRSAKSKDYNGLCPSFRLIAFRQGS